MNATPFMNGLAVPPGIRTMVHSRAFSLELPPFTAAELSLVNRIASGNEFITTADMKDLFSWPSRIYTTMWVMPRSVRKGLVERTHERVTLTAVGRAVAELPLQHADISLRNLALLSIFAAFGEMHARQLLTSAVSVFGRSRFGSQRTSPLAGPGSVYAHLAMIENDEQFIVSRTVGQQGPRIRIYNLSTIGRRAYESWLPVLQAYEA